MGKNRKKKNVVGMSRVPATTEGPCAISMQLNAYYFGQERVPKVVNKFDLVCNRLDLSQHWETRSMQTHFSGMQLVLIVAELDAEISDFITGITARCNIDQWTWTENLWHVFITHIGEFNDDVGRVLGSEGYHRRRLFVSKAMDSASDLVSDEEIYDSIRSWNESKPLPAPAPS